MQISGYMITGYEEIGAPVNNLYRGPAKYNVWPLNDTSLAIDKWLFEQQINIWSNNSISNIMLVDDWDFVRIYLHRCHQTAIPTHLFWLSSDGSCSPVMNALKDKITVEFYGWDYLGGCDESYLFDDGNTILHSEKDPLQGVCNRMTKYGLFASFEDAQLYAAVRRTSPLKHRLEMVDDAHLVAVYHLTLNDIFKIS